MAISNHVRDLMAVLAFYVVAYMIAFTMQRMFWTKWYLRAHMQIQNYVLGYPRLKYFMTGMCVFFSLS